MTQIESHPDDDQAVYVISIAAELSGMHPQTLRQYDRMGLVHLDERRDEAGGTRFGTLPLYEIFNVLSGMELISQVSNALWSWNQQSPIWHWK
jgi:hypothetical protein